MNEFGNFIQKKRQSLGLTIRHAASLIGVSPTFLCDLESGDRAFPLNSRKGDLSASFASAYKMNEAEIADFKKMSELSALQKNRVSRDLVEYLKNSRFAQVALRTASEKKVDDDFWVEVVDKLNDVPEN